jgi:hypothetical protein
LRVRSFDILFAATYPSCDRRNRSSSGGALWPVLSIALKLPQRPRSDPDHV